MNFMDSTGREDERPLEVIDVFLYNHSGNSNQLCCCVELKLLRQLSGSLGFTSRGFRKLSVQMTVRDVKLSSSSLRGEEHRGMAFVQRYDVAADAADEKGDFSAGA